MENILDGKRLLFATGGTAGHINPALSVAGIVRTLHPNAEILFVGTADHMEARLVPQAGFSFQTIDISGFQRSFSPHNIKRNLGTLKRLFTVGSACDKILDAFKPDIAIGFGGYVSGPVLRAAAKRGIPTAIHESNAFPGVTNKALAKRADAVMLAIADAKERIVCKNPPVVTGMPVRSELLRANRSQSRAELGLDKRPMLLSMGGSLGARAVNDAFCGMMPLLKKEDFCYHHAYGQYGKWVPDTLAKLGFVPQSPALVLREYIDDMPRVLSAADLVISRAGASALSELQALGKPSILIPSPNVAENHQYFNAKALADTGAAVLIAEKELTPEKLADVVKELLHNPAKLQSMGQAAQKNAHTDAAERIYNVICSLLQAI